MAPPVPSTRPDYDHVLVPLDGSELATAALPPAAALAERFGAQLHAVTVVPDDDGADGAGGHLASSLGAEPGDDRVHVLTGDDPAGAIIDLAADLGNTLVCLATRGRGRVAGAVVGSVAREVLQRSPDPIVAVGVSTVSDDVRPVQPPPALSVDRIVACVDGGDASEEILPVAAAWAEALGMSLTILTVAEPSPPPLRETSTWHRHHGPERDADQYVAELADRWQGAVPEATGVAVYDPISAADGIRTHLESAPAGLVAVTTHARSGLDRVVLGAGAAAIVAASSAPVLVLPLTPR